MSTQKCRSYCGANRGKPTLAGAIKEVSMGRKPLNLALGAVRVTCGARRTARVERTPDSQGSTEKYVGLVALKLCSRSSKRCHFLWRGVSGGPESYPSCNPVAFYPGRILKSHLLIRCLTFLL